MMDIRIEDVGPQMVMGLTRKGKYQMIPQMLAELFGHLVAKRAPIAGMPTFVCHELSAEEAKRADAEGCALVEVVVPVAGKVEGTDEIKFYELPGGRMVMAVHKGPYEQCERTYQSMFSYIGKERKRVVGPIRETYLNDPRQVPPEETLTEIRIPIG